MTLKIKVYYEYDYKSSYKSENLETFEVADSIEVLECSSFKIKYNSPNLPIITIDGFEYAYPKYDNEFNLVSFSIGGTTETIKFKNIGEPRKIILSEYYNNEH